MAVTYNQRQQKIYYHMSTTNKSFLEMHYFLKDRGITNNRFHLVLYDPDLAAVDPRDPRLNRMMKMKVLQECIKNYWYFIRVVVRVPTSGIATGIQYQLHRGNLALSYCASLNLNIFLELPRQVGKTTGALTWYLWLLNFGTANSEMSFLHKRLEDSKYNLNELKELRDLLPDYLRMDATYNSDGTKSKFRSNVESISHPVNGNRIRTVASARNKTSAASLLRGRTIPIIYGDEWGFIPYNQIVYTNMVPAFITAANNSKMNGKPYGIILTTTPGLLTTDEGQFAFRMKETATRFDDSFYDLSYDQLMELVGSNNNSNFMYIKYSYQQLGKSEAWFKDLCINMQLDWVGIRREILLEWSQTAENSPFRKEDLDTVKSLIRQPISTILLLNKYIFNIYDKLNHKYPPLVGVDVSGGYQRDSSAITIVDSYTTNVTAEMNCNYISTPELAAVICEIVTKYMPNAVVNIERNGGYGASVLAKLVKSPIKKNLFYTIKDKIIEERVSGAQIVRKTQKTKIYGSDSTHNEREELMEIMRDRVEYHKDKIISPTIYDELCGLEVKKNGRIEHSSNTHDDQIFSWLWALYMYYNGADLMTNWGIVRRVLKTDSDLEEAIYETREESSDIADEIEVIDNEEVQEQLKILDNAPGQLTYEQWMQEEFKKDQDCLNRILQTKVGREAYNRQFNVDISMDANKTYTLSDDVFNTVYSEESDNSMSARYSRMFSNKR